MPGSGCQFWEVTVPHGTHWTLPEAEVTTVRVADIPSGTGEGPLFSENLLENSVSDQEQHCTVFHVRWGRSRHSPLSGAGGHTPPSLPLTVLRPFSLSD